MHLLHLNDDVLTEIIGLLRTADRASLLQTSRILHILVTPHFPDTVVLSKSPRHTANFFTYIFSNVKDRAPPIRRFELERSGFVEDSVESDAEVHAFLVTPLLIELLAHTRSLDTLVISSLHELERSKRGLCRAIALLPSLRTAAFHETEWTGLLSRQMHLALSSIEVSPIRNVIASTSQGLDALGAIRRLSASLESLELRFSPPTDNYPQEPPALLALTGNSWPRVRQLIMDAAESSPRYIDVEWLSQAFPTVEHLTVEGHAPGTTLIPASHVSGASWRSLRSVHGDVASMSHIPLSVNVHSLRLWPSTRGPLAHNLHRDDALLFNILSQTSGTRFLHLKGGRWGFPSRAIWSSIASMQTLIYLQIEMRYRSNPPLDSMRNAVETLAVAPSLLYVSFSMTNRIYPPGPAALTEGWELELVVQPLAKLSSGVSYVENPDAGAFWEIIRPEAGKPAIDITRKSQEEAERIKRAFISD